MERDNQLVECEYVHIYQLEDCDWKCRDCTQPRNSLCPKVKKVQVTKPGKRNDRGEVCPVG